MMNEEKETKKKKKKNTKSVARTIYMKITNIESDDQVIMQFKFKREHIADELTDIEIMDYLAADFMLDKDKAELLTKEQFLEEAAGGVIDLEA